MSHINLGSGKAFDPRQAAAADLRRSLEALGASDGSDSDKSAAPKSFEDTLSDLVNKAIASETAKQGGLKLDAHDLSALGAPIVPPAPVAPPKVDAPHTIGDRTISSKTDSVDWGLGG
jgi:hypothetical protein